VLLSGEVLQGCQADGFAQPPPPRPGQAGAVRPFAHTTETSRLNSIAAPHWNDPRNDPRNDPTSAIAERCLKQSVESRGPLLPRSRRDMGLEKRIRKPRYTLPIPFYIERLPTYD
jgi:hypothetical protein